jgi:hypothetical protein
VPSTARRTVRQDTKIAPIVGGNGCTTISEAYPTPTLPPPDPFILKFQIISPFALTQVHDMLDRFDERRGHILIISYYFK